MKPPPGDDLEARAHHGRVVGVEDEPAVVRLRQGLGARLEFGPQAVVVRMAPRR